MKGKQQDNQKYLLPMRLADDANQGFVKMVQYIGRIISLDSYTKTRGPVTCAHDANINIYQNSIASAQCYHPSYTSINVPGENPAFFDHFSLQNSDDKDEKRRKIQDLFSDSDAHRLSSIRWVNDENIFEAVPLLEGILIIESNHQISDLIRKVLSRLKEEMKGNDRDRRISSSV